MTDEIAPGKPRFYQEANGLMYERSWRYDSKGEKLCLNCTPVGDRATQSSALTRPTSTKRTALQNLRASGAMTAQQQRVLEAIKPGQDYTRNELERNTGIRINAICGRVAELIDRGEIEPGPPRRCKLSGQMVHTLRRKQSLQEAA